MNRLRMCFNQFNLRNRRFWDIHMDHNYRVAFGLEMLDGLCVLISQLRVVVGDNDKMGVGRNFVQDFWMVKDIIHPERMKFQVFLNDIILNHFSPPRNYGCTFANFASTPAWRKSGEDYNFQIKEVVCPLSHQRALNPCGQSHDLCHSGLLHARNHEFLPRIGLQTRLSRFSLWMPGREADLFAAMKDKKDIRLFSSVQLYHRIKIASIDKLLLELLLELQNGEETDCRKNSGFGMGFQDRPHT